jgi:ketosteroid isomerase-like protein
MTFGPGFPPSSIMRTIASRGANGVTCPRVATITPTAVATATISATTATTPAEVISLPSAALQDGRIADALALFEPDAVFVPQPNAQPLAGREAIEQALTQFAALRPHMASNIRSVVTAGAVATVINAWQLRGTRPTAHRSTWPPPAPTSCVAAPTTAGAF